MARKKYTKEFKEQACKLVLSGTHQLGDAARELGISRSAVAQWYSIPDWHIPAISKILEIPQYQLRGESAPRPKAVA